MAVKTVEEIKAEVIGLVKSQGNQGAISLGTVLDDITELAGEGGGDGDAATIGGIPVFRVDGQLNTMASEMVAIGPLKDSEIAATIFAEVGYNDFLVVSNYEYTEDVESLVSGKAKMTPGIARGKFTRNGADIIADVQFVTPFVNGAYKVQVFTLGVYLVAAGSDPSEMFFRVDNAE